MRTLLRTIASWAALGLIALAASTCASASNPLTSPTEFDSSGKAIGQRIEWVPGGVPGFTQVYFEIGHLAAAASYRVTVWDYSFIEARGAVQ